MSVISRRDVDLIALMEDQMVFDILEGGRTGVCQDGAHVGLID